MNKKKRALALGLATTQLAALSAVVAPLTAVSAFAETASGYTVTATVTISGDEKTLKYDSGSINLEQDNENTSVTVSHGETVNIVIGDIASGKKISKVTLNGKEAPAEDDGSYNYTVGENETSISVVVEVVTELAASYTAESVSLANTKPESGNYEFTDDDKTALLAAAKAAVKIDGTTIAEDKLAVDDSAGYGAVAEDGNEASVTVTLTLTDPAKEDYAYADGQESISVKVPVSYKTAEKTELTFEVGEVSLGTDLEAAPDLDQITAEIKKQISFKDDKNGSVELTEGDSDDYTVAVEAKIGDDTGKVYTVTVTIVNTGKYNLAQNTANVTVIYTVKEAAVEVTAAASAAADGLTADAAAGADEAAVIKAAKDSLTDDVLKTLIEVTYTDSDGEKQSLTAGTDYTVAISEETPTVTGDGAEKTVALKLTITLNDTDAHVFADEARTADVDVSVTVTIAEKTVGVDAVINNIPQVESADKVTIALKSGDKAVDNTTAVKKGDTLTLTVTLADGYKYTDSGAPTVTAAVGSTNAAVSSATTEGNVTTFTITVPDLADAADGTKLSVTVTGAVEKDVTPYTIKLPSDGTGYTVAAAYNDGSEDKDIPSEGLPVGTDVKITVTAATGYKLVDAQLGEAAAVTSADGSTVELTYTVAKPESGTEIDLSGALKVNTLKLIKPALALNDGVAAATPVELTITESELASAADTDLAAVSSAVKVTDSADSPITLAAADYTLTVGKTADGTDDKTITVTFALTADGEKKYAVDESVTNLTIKVPVKFAVEYAISAKNVSNATITLDKNKGKADTAVKITIAPADADHVIDNAPTLAGVTFAKNSDGNWEGTYTVAAADDDDTDGAIELDITVTVLAYATFTTPAFTVDPETDKATLTFTEAGTYSVDGGEQTIAGNGTLEYEAADAGKELEIILKGNGTTTADSKPVKVKVPEKGSAPSGLSYDLAETDAATNGFTITGLTAAMQYKKDGDTSWTDFTDGTKLQAGTYSVRTKATASAFASETVTLEVTTDAKLNVAAEAAEITGLTYDPERTGVDVTITLTNEGANTDAECTVVLPEGWTAKSGITEGKVTVAKGGSASVAVTVPAKDAKAYSGSVTFTNGMTDDDLVTYATVSPLFTIAKADITLTVSGTSSLTSAGGDITFTTNAPADVAPTLSVSPAGATVDGLKVTFPENKTQTAAEYTVTVTAVSDNYNITNGTATVTVAAAEAPVGGHTITVTASANGSVTTDEDTAEEGDEITLTVTPDTGYKLDTLTVTGPDGEKINVANNKFTMPAGNVTVTATFTADTAAETSYAINKGAVTNGTISFTVGGKAATTAKKGDVVTVVATANSGYTAGAITVKDAAGKTVTVTGSTFTMPDSEVTVTAAFNRTSSGGSSSGGSSGGGNRRPSGGGSTVTGTTNSEITSMIGSANEGGTIKANGTAYIFSEVVKEAADKKVKLEVKVDDAFTWNIEADKLTDTNTALRLTVETKTVDTSQTAKIEKTPRAADKAEMSFTTYAANLGTGAALTVKTSARPTAAVPQFANLYKTKADGTLEFVAAAPIDANGNATLPITAAGTYTIVTSTETKKPGDINNDCKVDIHDISEMLNRFVNSTGTLTRAQDFKMDYDNDSVCRISDISIALSDFVNGKI